MKDQEKELGEKMWVMGSEESEKKAVKLVAEISSEQDKLRADWEFRWLNIFDGKKFRKMEYHLAMRTLLLSLVSQIDFPQGYTIDVLSTEEGVVLKMRTPQGRFFAQGVESLGTPKYDFEAMLTVSFRLENTLDRLEGRDTSKETIEGDDLILPGSDDYFKTLEGVGSLG